MNHEQGSRYLALCLDKGLIAKVEETFRPTDQGAAYLENWSKIEGYLTR